MTQFISLALIQFSRPEVYYEDVTLMLYNNVLMILLPCASHSGPQRAADNPDFYSTLMWTVWQGAGGEEKHEPAVGP